MRDAARAHTMGMNEQHESTDRFDVSSIPSRNNMPRRWRSRIVLALAAALAALSASPAPVRAAAAGVCTFGTAVSAGSLTFTMTPTRITIIGSGTCIGAVGGGTTNTVYVRLDGAGTFGCDFGLGGMAGSLVWSPGPPYIENTFQVRLATVANVVSIVLTDLNFNGAASFSWPATDIPACLANGSATEPLTGVMTFAAT